MKFKASLLMISMILVMLTPYLLFAQDEGESKGELVNRKVILLDFDNATGYGDANYLTTSLPDTIETKINQTGKFNLDIKQDEVYQAAQSLNIDKTEFYNETNALSIAKSLDADVVVIGQFIINGDDIKIVAKALDVETERVAATSTENGSLGVELFDLIDFVADDLAQKMVQTLPPLTQKFKTKEYTMVLPSEEYPGDYSSVKIIGDFTGWQPKEMRKVDGQWQADVQVDILKKNEYEYMFIVDNEEEIATRNITFKIDEGVLVEDIDYFHPQLGFRPGAHFLFGDPDIANRIDMRQPSINAYFKMNIPLPFMDVYDFGFEFSFGWFHYRADTSNPYNSAIEGFEVPFHNFPIMLTLLYDFHFLNKSLYVYPRLGGGTFIHYCNIEDNTEGGANDTSEVFVDGFLVVGGSFGWKFAKDWDLIFHVDFYWHMIGDLNDLMYITVGPGITYNF